MPPVELVAIALRRRRRVSYRVAEAFPLIALVSASEAEVYRQADSKARIYWGIALLVTTAILGAIGWGARRENVYLRGHRS
jgi:hypothetical protein